MFHRISDLLHGYRALWSCNRSGSR